jgi:PAS domain S-box-containing protein
MVSLFVPREFPDPVDTLTARHFHWLVISMMAIVTPALLLIEIFVPLRFPRDLGFALIVDADGLILLYLARRRMVKLGSILLVATLYIIVTSAVWTAGGVSAPAVNVYYVIPFFAALLLGTSAAIGVTVAIFLTGIILISAKSAGVLPAADFPTSPASLWALHSMSLTLILVLYITTTGTLKGALDQAAAQLKERMRVQDDLVTHEQMLSSVLNSVPQSVFWKDSSGRYMGCNAVFARAAGLQHTDLVRGKTDFDLPWQNSEAEAYRADDAEVIRSGHAKRHIVEPLQQADGTRLLVDTTKVPLLDGGGNVYGVIGIYEDITERHRMEEAVRKSEEKFSRVFYSSPIPMGITVLSSGEIVDINESFCTTFGYKRQDILDRKPLEVGIWTVPEERDELVRTLRERGAVRNRPTNYRSKSGRMGVALLCAEIIEIDGNECVVFMAIDITELKGAEQEVRSSRNQLRRLGAHLEKVREEERTHVAREIHDQLGQELTGLKMDLAWCISRIPAEQKALSDRAKSMMGLLDETVHTVRRIASELRPGILDDLGLIAALEWQAQEFQQRSGIACAFTSGPGDRPLDIGRTTALFRIFQETLTNVARHSHATRVEAILRWEQDHVGLEVVDNGIGFPDAGAEPVESFGILGMKERAMMFDGELCIAQTNGGGTTISVEIPTPL